MRTCRLWPVALALPVLVLSGCGGLGQPVSLARDSYDGIPKQLGTNLESFGEPAAVWLDAEQEAFAVVLYGSSSCPSTPVELTVVDEQLIELRLARSQQDPCTADIAARTHEFGTPSGVGDEVSLELVFEEGDPYRIPIQPPQG